MSIRFGARPSNHHGPRLASSAGSGATAPKPNSTSAARSLRPFAIVASTSTSRSFVKRGSGVTGGNPPGGGGERDPADHQEPHPVVDQRAQELVPVALERERHRSRRIGARGRARCALRSIAPPCRRGRGGPLLHENARRARCVPCGGCSSRPASTCSGEGGIRTHGTVTRTHDFQSCTFGLSVTSPGRSPQSSRTRHFSRRDRCGSDGGAATAVAGDSSPFPSA
jgi:hypothetical protein